MVETRRAMLAAAGAGFAGALLFLLFAYWGNPANGIAGPDLSLLAAAPTGSALAALLIWPKWQGAWAGAAIGFLAHPFMWLAQMLLFDGGLRYWRIPDPGLLQAAATASAYSLLVAGWATLPLGAVLGWRLAPKSRS